MRKLIVFASFGFILGFLSSCGGGHICDAYGGQADYSKNKVEHNSKMGVVAKLTQAKHK